MLTHDEMTGLQAERHILITEKRIKTKEQYVLHLIHTSAYRHLIPLAQGNRVLDLGCNTGYGSVQLAEVAQHVTGVDVSASAIEAAKQSYKKPNLEFLVTDGKALPFDKASYDVVVSCQVIEHIVDYQMFLSEIKRVLSPDGIVVFTTPNALIRLDPGMKPWNKFHVREFSADELAQFLDQHFPQVNIYGLQAEEPLARIERTRVDNIRRSTRHQNIAKTVTSQFKSAAKAIIPRFVIDHLMDQNAISAKQLRELEDVRSRYSAEDFFYSQSDLDNSLDLLAVCGLATSRTVSIVNQ